MRTYDDANRLTQIRHEGPGAQLLTQIDYNWRLDNTIDSRTETDATAGPQSVATVTFEYDNRRRPRYVYPSQLRSQISRHPTDERSDSDSAGC